MEPDYIQEFPWKQYRCNFLREDNINFFVN